MLHRRTFLLGLIAAPAIVRYSSLMPVRSNIILPASIIHVGNPPLYKQLGDMYFDFTSHLLYVFDGAVWTPLVDQ